jgi:hypothetical protein
MEDATLPVDARMHVAFRAVAPRIPLAVTYDPQAVARRIAAHLGEGAVIPAEEFERLIDSLLAGPEIVTEGDFEAVDPLLRAGTAALRMRERFSVRAESDPGRLKLIPPSETPAGRERIDFAEPAAVLVEQTLSLDPLAAARAMRKGSVDDLVRRIEVPPVPTGRQRIAVSANLPEPILGLQMLIADLQAPALPPFRPLPDFASVSLEAADRSGEAALRLSPGEPLDYQVRLRGVVMKDDQPVEISGPWRQSRSSSVLLGPGDFGAPLLVMRASRALTSLAVVEALSDGRVVARLDAATPMMAIPLTDEITEVVARPLGEGRAVVLDLESGKRLDLDLATLPGFGAHRARLATTANRPFLVEWRPDGDEEAAPQAVRMGPDSQTAEIGWVAFSPFRPGMVWRLVRDGTTGPWSEVVLPKDELLIEVDGGKPVSDIRKSFVIEGVELKAKDASGRAWTYVPPRPALEKTGSGAPMLQVIEAGPAAFLQCTARVALNEDARAQLLATLKQKAPEAETLEAVPLSVERIALEAKVGNQWAAVAESTGSGTPPWTAALAATLTAEPLAALKSAVAGERDHARLIARIVLAGSPASFRRAETRGEARVEMPAGSAAASFAASTEAASAGGEPQRRELAVDIADCFSKAGLHN